MYRLIIADDEIFIRKGLCEGVDWASLGYEVVNSFSDGLPAIEYIKHNLVDVVLTDIRMSKGSGLDIAKYVHENAPEIKVVLLSGFQEFELAQKSIDYGVERYLLKPINVPEIKSVFSKLKAKLDAQREAQKQSTVDQENHQELLSFAKSSWLQDLYYGVSTDYKSIVEQAGVLYKGVEFDQLCCVVIHLQIDHYSDYLASGWKYGQEALTTSILNIMQLDSAYEFFNISSKNGHELFLGVIRSNSMDDSEFHEYITKTRQHFKELLSIEVTIIEATFFKNPYDFANSRTNFAFDPATSSFDSSVLSEIEEFSKLILTNLTTLHFETGKKLIHSFIDKLSDCPIWLKQSFTVELVSSIRHTFTEINAEAVLDPLECLYQINHATSSEELIDAVCTYINEFIQYAPPSVIKQEEGLVQKAKNYIELHYNQDISLDILADVLYINKSYLCRLFKEKAGVTFTDYLISLRIQKAAELINQSIPLQRVSEMVGYRDSRYFSRLFKNKTGMTPSEYKKSLKEEA